MAMVRNFDARTRKFMIVGAAGLIAALAFAYLWLPAARGRVALAERIPVLNAKLATMHAQAEEIKLLNAQPANASTTTRAPASRADRAALETVFGNGARVTPTDANGFQIVIANIAYTAWIDRLDQVAERFQLQLGTLAIKPIADKAGQVSVEFTLNAQDSAKGTKP
jgi:type II secretory pathway component PulM